MSSFPASALYVGAVMHKRHKPKPHRLQYRVFSLLVDLDEIDVLAGRLRLFSHNRFNLFSLFDRDHGAGAGSLKAWAEAQVARAGIDLPGGRIVMLCYPRILGFVFNPLTVFFCLGADGRPRAMIYEVRNTFGDKHAYLLAVPDGDDPVVRHGCAKGFHVSPFVPMEARYDFRVLPPADKVILAIHETDGEGALLDARFIGHRRALNDRTLFELFLSHPLMTLKVVAGIHWEAFKLWRKGAPFFSRPAPPATDVSIVVPSQPTR